VEGLDPAMRRWRKFEHVWNMAVTHELCRPKDYRPHYSNPMTFSVDLRMPKTSVQAKQEINLGEGGNELFIQQEQVTCKIDQVTERIARDAFGKLTLAVGDGKMQFKEPRLSFQPKYEDGQSVLKEMTAKHLESWQFLRLVPDVMGHPAPQQRAAGTIRLATNGANFAEYLDAIRTLDPNAFDGIQEAL